MPGKLPVEHLAKEVEIHAEYQLTNIVRIVLQFMTI